MIVIINPLLGVGSKMTPRHLYIWRNEAKKGYDGFNFCENYTILNFPIRFIFYFTVEKNNLAFIQVRAWDVFDPMTSYMHNPCNRENTRPSVLLGCTIGIGFSVQC